MKMIVRKFEKKFTNNSFTDEQEVKEKEGTVHIKDGEVKSSSSISNKDGEYIDYEEIND